MDMVSQRSQRIHWDILRGLGTRTNIDWTVLWVSHRTELQKRTGISLKTVWLLRQERRDACVLVFWFCVLPFPQSAFLWEGRNERRASWDIKPGDRILAVNEKDGQGILSELAEAASLTTPKDGCRSRKPSSEGSLCAAYGRVRWDVSCI